MNKTQEEIIGFIQAFFTKRGYAPTLIEIAREVNMSPQGVATNLLVLEAIGKVKMEAGKKRNIAIV